MRIKILKSRYKFLQEIPILILTKIDLNCLDLASEKQLYELHILENRLNSNIVIYKKGYKESGLHLCRTIHSSELSDYEQVLIKQFESLYLNSQSQIAVAYKNPVQFI